MEQDRNLCDVYIIPPEDVVICQSCIYCYEDEVGHLAGDISNGHCEKFHKAIDLTEDICPEYIERNYEY